MKFRSLLLLLLAVFVAISPVLAQTTYAPMIMGYTPCSCNGRSGSGTNGSWWWAGTGTPPLGLGNDGDFYLNEATADIYNRTTGVWVLRLNIMGPPGGGEGSAADAVKTADEHIEQNRTSEHNAGILAGNANATLPAASTANNIVTFLDATGKVLKDSGISISSFLTSLAPAVKSASDLDTANVTAEAVNNTKTQAAAVKGASDLDSYNVSATTRNLTAALPIAGNTSVPASSLANDIVTFLDTTGHAFKDSGSTLEQVINQALIRDTNISVGGGVASYSFNVQALTSSPADSVSNYFWNVPAVPTTTAGQRKIYIRQPGYIRGVEVYTYAGTTGTSEAFPLYIAKNGDTGKSRLVQSVAVATSERVFTNWTLDIPVVKNDYIEMRFVNPAWATNPLTFIVGGYVYLNTTVAA